MNTVSTPDTTDPTLAALVESTDNTLPSVLDAETLKAVGLSQSDLPAITEAQAREFAQEAYALIPQSLRPKSLCAGHRAAGECANLPEQRGTYAAVADALTCILNADLDYDSWVRIAARPPEVTDQLLAALDRMLR